MFWNEKYANQIMETWDIAQNYLCAYAKYIDVHVFNIWMFITDVSWVMDINVEKENKYGYQMYNIGHMTFTFKFDLGIMKFNMFAKNRDAASRYSRVIVLWGTQTYIDRDRCFFSHCLLCNCGQH